VSRGSFTAVIGALALLAFCTVLIATPWGVGLAGDSPVYVGTARNLLAGNGVIYLNDGGELSPVSHYPPLYSLAIAGFALTGSDPLTAARWLNAFLFAANVVLAGVMAFAATGSSGASLAAAFLAFVSFPIVQIHSMAWSEPLFTFLGFSGLLLLGITLQLEKHWMLWASGIMIGLSCLTRYAGIAFVGTGALGILLLGRKERRMTVRDAAIFLALSSLPLAVWAMRNLWLAGSTANRGLAFHPPGIQDLITGINSLCLWFLPVGILAMPVWVRLAALGVLTVLLIRFAGTENFSESRFVQLIAVFLGGYGIFVFVARCFFDRAISFETRILSPAYIAAMILVLAAASRWVGKQALTRPWPARSLLYSSVIAILIMQSATAITWWRHSYRTGIGFAESTWSRSELLNFVNTVQPPAPIFTNVPDLIYMWTGKRTAMIPRKVHPMSRLPNEQYLIEVANMKQALKNRSGVVAYFHAEERLWYLPSADELQKTAGLRLVALDKHGSLYLAE
jgi:4-amino-4-deoxy-L-arabinose transferase-like glycosyltransferase